MFTSTTIPKTPASEAVLLALWESCDAKLSDVHADTELIADLGMDSLDVVETVMAVEDALTIDIDDALFDGVKNIGQVIAVVDKVLGEAVRS